MRRFTHASRSYVPVHVAFLVITTDVRECHSTNIEGNHNIAEVAGTARAESNRACDVLQIESYLSSGSIGQMSCSHIMMMNDMLR